MTLPASILPVYRRAEVQMARGEGVYLFDAAGKRYLDFGSGIAVNGLGHCHPHLVAALREQVETLWHCSNFYNHPQLERFSARLTQAAGMDSVFFCNSGAEAVEAALKFTRRYFYKTGKPERYKFVVAEGAFHGRTLATLSSCRSAKATEGYAPLVQDWYRMAPFNDASALEALITPETAAIMLEPVQGEVGIRPHSAEYLQAARAICDKHELMLVFDEVQCGMGRPGSLFAFEALSPLPLGEVDERSESGEGNTPSPCSQGLADLSQRERLKPDMIILGKGIGNGFPLAACLVNREVAAVMEPGCHGSTFGSNPLAMRAGNAVLDVMLEPGFFEQVRQTAAELRNAMQAVCDKFPNILGEVRGLGMLLGIPTKISAYQLSAILRENGLLLLPAGDGVIRVMPPLIVEKEHIANAVTIMEKILASWPRS